MTRLVAVCLYIVIFQVFADVALWQYYGWRTGLISNLLLILCVILGAKGSLPDANDATNPVSEV